jgi:hypothetical protein
LVDVFCSCWIEIHGGDAESKLIVEEYILWSLGTGRTASSSGHSWLAAGDAGRLAGIIFLLQVLKIDLGPVTP